MALTTLARALLTACLALPPWRALASTADARAAFERGLAADLGTNGRPDPNLAYRYYRQAAELGDPDAELNLGVMSDSGVGTLADSTQAALWYARAASHGYGRAAFDLGQLYEAGDGVPRNLPMAAAWFGLAAHEGIEAASSRARRLVSTGTTDDGPAAPAMVAPAAGQVLPNEDVEMVWTPASTAPDTQYWVQVAATKSSQTLSYRETDVSAMLVHVPAEGDYAWRVFAASPGHYRASQWSAFSVRAGDVCCLAALTR